MHDGVQYDPIQGQGQGHRVSNVFLAISVLVFNYCHYFFHFLVRFGRLNWLLASIGHTLI